MPFDEISIDDIDLEFIKTITLTDVYEYMNFVSTQRKNNATTRSRKDYPACVLIFVFDQ